MAYSGNTNSNRGGGRPAPDGFEQVLQIRRVSKKTQGGTNVSFSALVVTGDKKGKVGLGLAKAPNVADAIKKLFLTNPLPNMAPPRFSSARLLRVQVLLPVLLSVPWSKPPVLPTLSARF